MHMCAAKLLEYKRYLQVHAQLVDKYRYVLGAVPPRPMESEICDSPSAGVPINPLLIVLNEMHLKINMNHFVRTTGGCRDNRTCFCVTGGQLSLCC